MGRYSQVVSPDVQVVRAADDEVTRALAVLLPQLPRSANAINGDGLSQLLESDATRLLVARVDGRIVGTLSLVMFPVPTGMRARIEDIVVDEGARGLGVGEALIREAVGLARANNARMIDLTSRPSLMAANRLCDRLGFQLRDSWVYRLNDLESI
jgi:ribosomal protein S18 acetylase RimI-like enzyme